MAFPHHFRLHWKSAKRAVSTSDGARIKNVVEPTPKRRLTNVDLKSSEPLDGMLLRWTLKRLSADLLLQQLTFTRAAALELSWVCKQFAQGVLAASSRQNCDPSAWALPLRGSFARFPIGRLIESRYTAALYRAPAGIHDVLVYLKCRYEAAFS